MEAPRPLLRGGGNGRLPLSLGRGGDAGNPPAEFLLKGGDLVDALKFLSELCTVANFLFAVVVYFVSHRKEK